MIFLSHKTDCAQGSTNRRWVVATACCMSSLPAFACTAARWSLVRACFLSTSFFKLVTTGSSKHVLPRLCTVLATHQTVIHSHSREVILPRGHKMSPHARSAFRGSRFCPLGCWCRSMSTRTRTHCRHVLFT